MDHYVDTSILSVLLQQYRCPDGPLVMKNRHLIFLLRQISIELDTRNAN